MKHFLLYGHGTSYNHGAEASLKCDIDFLREYVPECRITVSSHFPEHDRQFQVKADEIIGRNMQGKTVEEVYKDTIDRITADTVCFSIGGDNYCYPNWERYAAVHKVALERGAKSILWSCSLEPEMMDDTMLEVLKSHHLITVRESHTYKALQERGLNNVVLVSDIAFRLQPDKVALPEGNYVILNLSPLVLRKNPKVLDAYQHLMDEILRKTELKIVLLPHVEVAVDNDKDVLDRLRGEESRVIRIPTGMTAAQYKYIISKAEACVAARTHATIAAWSTYVPTLAVGYSTKAKGIAEDLGQSEYVVGIETIDEKSLNHIFFDFYKNKEAIKEILQTKVPECKDRVLPRSVMELLGEMI